MRTWTRRLLKRTFDATAAALGVAVLAPAGLAVAAAIKLDDGGPIFYRQERVGRDGKPFRMWKFRTMSVDAAQRGPALTVGPDRRITRIGATLRRYKLDELPQLLNVLIGEMALVGPRPEVPRYVSLYDPEQRQVLALTPGITDRASIKYRNESELLASSEDPEMFYVRAVMPDKIRINLDYERTATFWSDVRVILATLIRI